MSGFLGLGCLGPSPSGSCLWSFPGLRTRTDGCVVNKALWAPMAAMQKGETARPPLGRGLCETERKRQSDVADDALVLGLVPRALATLTQRPAAEHEEEHEEEEELFPSSC